MTFGLTTRRKYSQSELRALPASSGKRLVAEGHLVAARLIEYQSVNQILDAVEAKLP